METSADIGVYWDENCTRRVDSISWGAIAPGEAHEVIVYVRNEGNEKLILNLTTLNWQPEDASLWLNFSWNCQDTNIGVDQVVKVTPILRVASDLPGGFSGFSFDTIFGGTVFPANAAPTVSNGYVTPTTGDTSTLFYYYVSYYDPEGTAPTDLKTLCIDGSEWHSMGLYSGSASNGVYRCMLTLSVGSHDYYFKFSDGVNTVYLPSSGSYSGPSIDRSIGTDHFPGDINKDGVVDVLDLAILAAAYGSTVGDARWKPEADLNKDDVVDVLDIAIVAIDWGNRNEVGT